MDKPRIGVYGLGTMGSALALNMAENGIPVAVTNRETAWIADFMARAGDLARVIQPHESLDGFIAGLEMPRIVLFMIPSGEPMDLMIGAVTPLLAPGDTIVDGGNADFHATRRRASALRAGDLHFVGMGISGGAEGARHGPSMMVGGTRHSWHQLRPILTAIAARHEGDPCVDRLGPDGAGHFVKTVHNGIEYAEMQIIAETYGLLRHGAAWSPSRIGQLLAEWNTGPLKSYLLEITAKILEYQDHASAHPMVDVIKDSAGQKGTGRWTVVEALRMGQSASIIEAAVGARGWSSEKDTRQIAETILGDERRALSLAPDTLARALMAARVLSHAQGFRILDAAGRTYDWPLDLARIAEIWRAGCIIRSALLDDISEAFQNDTPAGQLMLAPAIAGLLHGGVPALREVVATAVAGGHAVPALAAAICWYDTMRQGRGTANIIQAQRDFFGHHGFERLGEAGRHHGPWWD